MSKTNVAMYVTNCSFTLGRRHSWKPVYNKFPETEWCADNVFNVFLVLYMSNTNNDVNPELEKSRTFSIRDICRVHYIR